MRINIFLRQVRTYLPYGTKAARYINTQFLKGRLDQSIQHRSICYSPLNFVGKPRKQLFNSIDVSSDELYTSGYKYLQMIDKGSTQTDVLDDQINKLSGVLYQLQIRKDGDYLQKLFKEMSAHNLLNESAYTIVMRFYAEEKNLTKVLELFRELDEHPDISVHSRSYVPLINCCIRLEKFDLVNKYLQEMSKELQLKYRDNVIQDLLCVCTECLSVDNYKDIYLIVNEVFLLLEKYGSMNLKGKTLESIVSWFENDQFTEWHIQSTSMGKNNGMCQYCKKRLKHADIPAERLIRLKRNLMTLLKAAILRKESSRLTDVKPLKTNINIKNKVSSSSKYYEFYDLLTMDSQKKKKDTNLGMDSKYNQSMTAGDDLSAELFTKLNRLKTYLDANGPFDLVIDALNVGYFAHGFNTIGIRDLAQHFIDKKKKILILCAGPMKEELLTTSEVPLANRRVQQLMLYLSKHTSLFFVGSSVVDDYYILYTLIHHNFNIELVSRDLFRDHLFHLDAENTSDFQRWQKAHQFILKTITPNGEPIFRSRMNFNHAMQHHDNGWHVPVDDRAWLCISKVNQDS